MPYPSKRKVAARANAQKGVAAKAAKKEQEDARKALADENRQLRERLEEQKKVEKQLRSSLQAAEKRVEKMATIPELPRLGSGQSLCGKSKAIVCHVLQFAKEHHGPNAVKWTSAMTGIGENTLRGYKKKVDIPGKEVFKLPPCSSAAKKSSR
uniref:SWIB domain-containing protein n=1 Tax=Steinernema glaseri TaxID=37863 RepID=A0A1I8AP48_9BILA